MERLNINQADVDRHRVDLQGSYPQYGQPCPGSVLKLDDHVLWLGFLPGVVVWGHDDPDHFFIYAPDVWGDMTAPCDAPNITERAPADPSETPMPIYPQQPVVQQQQQQQQQPQDRRDRRPRKLEAKEAIRRLLAALPTEEARKRTRAYIRAHRADIELPPEKP